MIPYIILLLVVIVVLIIFKFKSIKQDFEIILTKIHDGENEIDELLNQKTNLMEDICENINSLSENPTFPSIKQLQKKKLDSISYDRDLNNYYSDLKEYLFVNKSYIPDEETQNKINTLNKVEMDLEATKKFYNDNSNDFNSLIDSFPAKIIARKKGYDFKFTYSFDKEEFFEILKQSDKKKKSDA